MAPTTEQVREIARATKQVCRRDGYGHQVVVWPSYVWSEAVGPTDVVAIGGGHSGWTYPIARFRVPLSCKAVREYLGRGETTFISEASDAASRNHQS